MLAVLGGFFLILFGRFFFLQVIRGDYFYHSMIENRRQIRYFLGERGRILDRNGTVLAKNRQSRDIAVVMARILVYEGGSWRRDMQLFKRLVYNLSRLLKTDQRVIWEKLDEIHRKITRKPFVFKGETIHDAIVLFRDVDHNIASEIEINRYRAAGDPESVHMIERYPGIEITTRKLRLYPEGRDVCHIIGYTGKISEEEEELFYRKEVHETDRIGKCGIERYYEEKLHGLVGTMMVDKFIENKEIQYEPIKVEVPETGEKLTLTVDTRLQKIVSQVFRDYEKTFEGVLRGACVILDPQNGEVLAMVSYPQYETNLFIPSISEREFNALLRHPGKPLLNRCIRGYPPGSTFKPILAIASIAEGIDIGKVTCVGEISLGRARFKCWKWKTGGHGDMDLRGSIRESCNVYFYRLGKELGIDTIHEYADMFGFGKTTGIDFEYEAAGINPSKEWKRTNGYGGWVPGDTLNTSIGQGFMNASPLQVALATAMIATGGKYIRPHLLKGRYEGHPKERERIMGTGFSLVREAMHEVTMDERGTAYGSFSMLSGLGVDSAGKTGSAEVGDEEEKTHSWYCGFCPYHDPGLAYSLIIENGGHGSEAAVPMMASILRLVYQHGELMRDLGIKPNLTREPAEEIPFENGTDVPEPEDNTEPAPVIID